MSPKLPDLRVYLFGGVVVIAAVWLLTRNGVAKEVAKAATTGAANLVDGVVSGVVVGAGTVVGVPDTDETECERAMREGRTAAASFACPAGRFIRWIAAGQPSEGVAP